MDVGATDLAAITSCHNFSGGLRGVRASTAYHIMTLIILCEVRSCYFTSSYIIIMLYHLKAKVMRLTISMLKPILASVVMIIMSIATTASENVILQRQIACQYVR